MQIYYSPKSCFRCHSSHQQSGVGPKVLKSLSAVDVEIVNEKETKTEHHLHNWQLDKQNETGCSASFFHVRWGIFYRRIAAQVFFRFLFVLAMSAELILQPGFFFFILLKIVDLYQLCHDIISHILLCSILFIVVILQTR